MTDKKTYGPKEVCSLANITPRQLNYWRLIGIVNPRCETHSTKVFHRYTQRDLKILQAIRQLTQEGYKVSKAAERIKAVMASTKDAFAEDSNLSVSPPENPKTQSMAYFKQRLHEEFSRAKRYGYPISCMALKISATSGPNGIEAFHHQVEQILLQSKRRHDVLVQVDVGEFLWLMPQTGEIGAKTALVRIKQTIQEKGLVPGANAELGIASINPETGTPESLINQARGPYAGENGKSSLLS